MNGDKKYTLSPIGYLYEQMDPYAIMTDVMVALAPLFPDATIAATAVSTLDTTATPRDVFWHAPAPMGKSYIKTIQSQLFKSAATMIPVIAHDAELRATWDVAPVQHHYIIESKSSAQPMEVGSSMVFPFVFSDVLESVIQVSSRETNAFSEHDQLLCAGVLEGMQKQVMRMKNLIDTQYVRTMQLIGSVEIGVVLFDTHGHITYVNPQATQYTGFTLEGMKIKLLDNLFGKKIDLNGAVDRALETGERQSLEGISLARHIFQVEIEPIRGADDKISGGGFLIYDVTKDVMVDTIKADFLSIASHQLRTPLTSINWYIEMLLNGDAGEMQEEQKEYVEEVYSSSQRMVALVNDLLNVSRIESGGIQITPVPLQLEEVLQEIVHDMELLAHIKECTLRVSFPEPSLPVMPIDPSKLRHVFENIVKNAIEYSPTDRKSEIVITVEPLTHNGKEWVTIIITDNGIGIPEQHQERIFEKFFRAGNAQTHSAEGNGLGLYLAKMIMDTAGGNIHFDSDEDVGTRFYIDIPITGMRKNNGSELTQEKRS